MLTHSRVRFFVALLFGGGLWAFVAYKAFTIPVTHDEVATPIHYIRFSVWEIMMYPDPWPNNHILNTLLVKLNVFLCGTEVWAVRLPNVLAFGGYVFAAYQICTILFKKNHILFTAGFTAFLFNPFLLDFFSLCRGYGLENALLLSSVFFYLNGFLQQKERFIWWSWVLAVLASYANFTALVFWCATTILTAVYITFFTNKKLIFVKMGVLAGLTLAYLALIYHPIRAMQTTNQFVYWKVGDFFQNTVVSLVKESLYGSNILGIPTYYYGASVVLLFFATGAYVVYLWRKNGSRVALQLPVVLAFVVFALTFLVNISQGILLHTPNLSGRTALLYYPLFVFLITSSLAHFNHYKPVLIKIISGVILVLGIWQMARTLNIHSVREWWFDASTFEVLKTLQKEPTSDQKVSLQTSWQLYRSFQFYAHTGKTPWLALRSESEQPRIDSLSPAQYYYVFESDYPVLKNQYHIIETYNHEGRLLLKRNDMDSNVIPTGVGKLPNGTD
jgi:hypothetical protein